MCVNTIQHKSSQVKMSPTRANSSQCEYGTIENEVHKSQHESELTRVDTNSICVNRSQNLDLGN